MLVVIVHVSSSRVFDTNCCLSRQQDGGQLFYPPQRPCGNSHIEWLKQDAPLVSMKSYSHL